MSSPDELTSRQKEVEVLLYACREVQEIAAILCITLDTVNNHIAQIYKKYGVKSFRGFMRVARERRASFKNSEN